MLREAMATEYTDPIATAAGTGCRDDESRWQAVVRRDRTADGAFVYSVATTGVYCRPSCAARLAKRENVAFHMTCEDAEAAGFRACKRCRPNEAGLADRQAAAVSAICRRIEQAVADSDDVPSLAALAAAAGLSRFHFHRAFREVTGVTPKDYAAAHRARLAARELDTAETVTAAIYGAGYGSNSRFYERSNERLGMTPSAYRDGGRGAEIRFAVGECSLGSILVAATDKGVCVIRFGDDANALVEALQDRFPKARLIGGDAAFEQLVAQVVGFVEAPARGLELPLDVRGTAFQEAVWRALREIPVGSTVSYADLAAKLGRPRAVRAVARACATNPVALAIPCHRVVRSTGALAGYAWGVERKRALLAREAK
jgi:AraC family transcriptional regulator, regulatory protein of adaptative response / methylated-DNA-[protein]-cysteine methyltransferase